MYFIDSRDIKPAQKTIDTIKAITQNVLVYKTICHWSIILVKDDMTVLIFMINKDEYLTTVSSLPDAFRNALVHLVFLGFRFFLKFLWHLDLQNWKTYKTHTLVKRQHWQKLMIWYENKHVFIWNSTTETPWFWPWYPWYLFLGSYQKHLQASAVKYHS